MSRAPLPVVTCARGSGCGSFRTPVCALVSGLPSEPGRQAQRRRCIHEAEARIEIESLRMRNRNRPGDTTGTLPDVLPYRRQAQREVHRVRSESLRTDEVLACSDVTRPL